MSENTVGGRYERQVVALGVAAGYGAGNPACQDGPAVLRAMGFLDDLEAARDGFRWEPPIRLETPGVIDRLAAVTSIATRLAERVGALLAAGNFPLVIGGDHSCAIGTWSGAKQFLGGHAPEARLGLLWVDAHMDSHTFRTSPSRNIHGMPLAALLGQGEPRLTAIAGPAPQLLPADACLLGVRSFERGEAELLASLGVRVYFMDEIKRRGLPEVFAEARARVCANTVGYGISIDLDALDPDEEPGVGTPVPDGLHRRELVDVLRLAHCDARLLALEIVEYNPYLDAGFATAQAIHDLCRSLLEPCASI
ncbi:MAG: arginase [Betaproteobacteria bacterium HGW-Betaproteobacteria-11]|nr:MAG: arginase [Betaproteobacteria bacterium HGW-Betaproteobacteria-11]